MVEIVEISEQDNIETLLRYFQIFYKCRVFEGLNKKICLFFIVFLDESVNHRNGFYPKSVGKSFY